MTYLCARCDLVRRCEIQCWRWINVEIPHSNILAYYVLLDAQCDALCVRVLQNYIRWQENGFWYRSTIFALHYVIHYCRFATIRDGHFSMFFLRFTSFVRFFSSSFPFVIVFGANPPDTPIPIASFFSSCVSQINQIRCVNTKTVNTSTLSRIQCSQSFNRAIINLIKSKMCNYEIL